MTHRPAPERREVVSVSYGCAPGAKSIISFADGSTRHVSASEANELFAASRRINSPAASPSSRSRELTFQELLDALSSGHR